MFELSHHLLLAIAVVAVAVASLRVAAWLSPHPLERVVAAVPIAVAFAVLSSLVLGFVRLGASPLALTGAAVIAWVAVRLLVPDVGARALRSHLAVALEGIGARSYAVIGMLLALAAVAILAALAHPVTGIDAAHYNLPESLAWIQSGTPGSVEFVEPLVPVGYQPLAHEVLIGWLLSIARSFTPLPFPGVGLLALAGTAGWLGLRRMDVPRAASGLAVAVLLTMPLLLGVATWPKNDIAVLGWLASAGALLVCARSRPRLVAPALVALGLALGTKSTALVPGFFLTVIGLWTLRHRLREVRGPAIGGLLVGLAVSAPWYLRDLIDNGSPLWPYLALPGGRPAIPFVTGATSFVEYPLETLRVTAPLNAFFVGPAPILLLAGMALCVVLALSRAVTAAAAVTVIGLLAWALAPFTGVEPGAPLNEVWSGAANVRYALPALCVALVAIALAARREGASRRAANATLAVALAANVVTLVLFAVRSQQVLLAPLGWVVAALVAGAVVGLAGARLKPSALVSIPALAAVAIAVVAALTVTAPGYPQRHETIGLIAPPELVRYLASDPDWRGGQGVVAMGPRLFAPAAGSWLQHPLTLATPANVCELAGSGPGWLALTRFSQAPDVFADAREGCLAGLDPVLDGPGLTIYKLAG